jgi:hypothetical protein
VTVLVWAPAGVVAWGTMRALEIQGELPASGDVRALEIGVFTFTFFVAGLLGALVAGRALVDAFLPRSFAAFAVAASVPLTVLAGQQGVALVIGATDRSLALALTGGAVVAGAAGGFLAVLRERDDERDLYQAGRSGGSGSRGWRSV